MSCWSSFRAMMHLQKCRKYMWPCPSLPGFSAFQRQPPFQGDPSKEVLPEARVVILSGEGHGTHQLLERDLPAVGCVRCRRGSQSQCSQRCVKACRFDLAVGCLQREVDVPGDQTVAGVDSGAFQEDPQGMIGLGGLVDGSEEACPSR